jgi:hypothetical protein
MSTTLPVLAARLRPNRKPRPTEGPYLVGCGVHDCPGVLASLVVGWDFVTIGSQARGVYCFPLIPVGFFERERNHFALGTHAGKSWRHAPRRPKMCMLWGQTPFLFARNYSWPETQGRVACVPHTFDWDERPVLYVTCPQDGCGRESVLTSEALDAFAREHVADFGDELNAWYAAASGSA